MGIQNTNELLDASQDTLHSLLETETYLQTDRLHSV